MDTRRLVLQLPTNMPHTLKKSPLQARDLQEFIECHNPETDTNVRKPGRRKIPKDAGASKPGMR
jgi:hypothetical protein